MEDARLTEVRNPVGGIRNLTGHRICGDRVIGGEILPSREGSRPDAKVNSGGCRVGKYGEGEEEDGEDLWRVGVHRKFRK